MLEVLVRNANGNLSNHDRDYAIKKLSKLDRYFSDATKAELAYCEDKHGHVIEVTVFADGVPLHGREADSHVNAAIDSVVDKLEAQLRKLKKRTLDRRQGRRERPNFRAA
ncbi:MAG: ribosome-associated translation inhibitor RaiA [Fimbriimonadaceae bacterium]|nr:ribosome-associated translation inhibitor RaiA [Fimbriimonadaceae bacterium]